jgi:hypothetical protein
VALSVRVTRTGWHSSGTTQLEVGIVFINFTPFASLMFYKNKVVSHTGHDLSMSKYLHGCALGHNMKKINIYIIVLVVLEFDLRTSHRTGVLPLEPCPKPFFCSWLFFK